MGLWLLMLITDLLFPAIMLGFGRLFLRRSPKCINRFYGYRTPRSMKNEKTWQFAHALLGKIWWKTGLFLVIPSIVPLFFVKPSDVDTVGIVGSIVCLAQTVVLILTIIPVERALKAKFDKDGNEKE